MATDSGTIESILSRLSSVDGLTAKKMFGEYALYVNEKVVALVCDNDLFLKKTEAGLAFSDDPVGVPPYPGAKNYLLVPRERMDDVEWLAQFVRATEAELPPPKPKKPRKAMGRLG